MMQVSRQSKIFAPTILVLTVVSSLVFVGQAAATNTTPSSTSQQMFCTRLSAVSASLNSQISKKINNLATLQDARANDIKIRFTNRNKELNTDRSHWDADRKLQYETMETKAITELQKQSLEQYKSVIESAVIKRRANIDTAMNLYRSSIDSSLSDGQDSIIQVVNNYKEAVVAAESKAQTNCAGGQDPTIVREAFRSDLQSAKETLVSSTNGLDKVSGMMSEVTNTRRNSIGSTINEFHSFVNQARERLKTALKQ